MYLKSISNQHTQINNITMILFILFTTGVLSTTLFYFEALLAGLRLSIFDAFEVQKFRWLLWTVAVLPFVKIAQKFRIHKGNLLKLIAIYSLIVVMMITISLVLLNIFLFRIQGIGLTTQQFLGNLRILFVSEFFFLLVTNLVILLVFNITQSKSNTIPQKFEINIPDKYVLETKSGLIEQTIRINKICWISGYDYYVKIHTTSKTHLLRKSLKKLEVELNVYNFIRVHRSSLINLSKVDRLIMGQFPYALLYDGKKVRISRRKIKSVATKFNNYKSRDMERY